MRLGRVIHCVDAHAEGEPSRIVVGGVRDVPGTKMLDKLRHLEREGDALRRLLLFEPRGAAPLSADLVLPSAHPEADMGFIIMESSSYEGMSGTNTINTATVLLETGMLPMAEPITTVTLEAPAGLVRVSADCAAGRCERVTFENVPSFATKLDAPVQVEGLGEVRVDVAYGGAFCAFVDAEGLGYEIVPDEARALAELGERIRPAVVDQVEIAHPVEPALGVLSFVVFTARPRVRGHARNATVVAPGRLDRSATGTATSARLALMAARGEIEDGAEFVNESVISTHFVGRIVGRTRVGDRDAVVPAITGRSWITGFHQLVLDSTDPFPEGFQLPDTWGAGRREALLGRPA
ncbi:MAG: proline racemase family protein [Thermoleophilaceae bacterium]|nr:proline racemase family protein [Thermoleophilaceae bacterium]